MPNNALIHARRVKQPDQPIATSTASASRPHQSAQKNLFGHQPVNKVVSVANHPKVADSFGSTPFEDICETDAFGAKPFCDAVQDVEGAIDSFGSVPFNPVASLSRESQGVADTPVTDAFGATPFAPETDGPKLSQRSAVSSSSSIASGKGGMKLTIRSASESPHHSLPESPLTSPLEESGFYLPLSNEPDRPRTAPQSPVRGNSPMPSDTAAVPASTLPKSASCVAVINREYQSYGASKSRQALHSFEESDTPHSPSVVFTDDKGIVTDEFGAVPFSAVMPEASLDPFGFEPFTATRQQRCRSGSRGNQSSRISGSLEDLSTVIGNPTASTRVPGPRTSGSSVSSRLMPMQGELKKSKSHDLLAGTPV